jgi:hypothetical protein
MKSPRNILYAHRAQAPRISLKTTGDEAPDYPRLQLIHSAASKGGVAADRNSSESAGSLQQAIPPTNTSMVAYSLSSPPRSHRHTLPHSRASLPSAIETSPGAYRAYRG